MGSKRFDIAKILLIVLMVFFGAGIFVQNFVISNSFDILSLRAIDDVAFQNSLRVIHTVNEAKQLLCLNDYGYGWIYWAPMALITYPAYLLQQASGVDWVLIVLPRMISLVFTMSSVVLMYKIISVYTKNEWIKFASIILFPLFPTHAYFAGRFATVGQVVFFSLLSVYLVIRTDTLTRNQLRAALISCAAALGTKLSAIIVVPLLAMLILNRYRWKINKENFIIWIPEIGIASIVSIAFISPAILSAVVEPQLALKTLQAIKSSVLNTNGNVEFFENVKQGIVFSTYSVPIFMALLMGIALKGFKAIKPTRNLSDMDFLSMFIALIISWVYLCLMIRHGAVYVLQYSLTIGFILPLGTVVLDSLKTKSSHLLVALICTTLIIAQLVTIEDSISKKSAFNPLEYFQRAEDSQDSQRLITELRDTAMTYTKGSSGLRILSDWSLPVFISPLRHKGVEFYSIWDNLSSWESVKATVIVLDKHSKELMTEKDFQNAIAGETAERKALYISDRACKKEFLDKRTIFGDKWILVRETNEYFMLIRDSGNHK